MSVGNVTDAVREELRRRVDERGTKYWAEFDEAQAIELASGYVSATVAATFLSMLAWMDEDKRAAARQTADTEKKRRRA